MEIRVGKHNLTYDGSAFQISRVTKAKKTGEEYQTDHAYYSRLDRALTALLDRVSGDNLRADRPEVTTLRELLVAVEDARVAVVEAVCTLGEAGA